ncbi:unnamed protein product [Didymodactylos carnosus]|uniref:Uncharacterized protein n=1 Tax=Didymodactylos carnosus TaxID=1234261 RepID=A0A8S2UFM9_9BILA|nr:unnamed protein product [Didymodactylos carnosus]CAF4312339.1 unnamed protein product [Didymodactylos carnosus]
MNNCLLSTSLDRSVSLKFIKSSDKLEGLERVFFEIDVDINQKSHRCGDISHLGYFPTKTEILFMIGSKTDVWRGQHTSALLQYEQTIKLWLNCINDDELNLLIDISKVDEKIGSIYDLNEEERIFTRDNMEGGMEIREDEQVWSILRDIKDADLAKMHNDLAISYLQSAFENTNGFSAEQEKYIY